MKYIISSKEIVLKSLPFIG